MRWLLLFLLALNAATCGQKGPLERPPVNDPQAANVLGEKVLGEKMLSENVLDAFDRLAPRANHHG